MGNRAMERTLVRMAKDCLPYRIDQRLLFPPICATGCRKDIWRGWSTTWSSNWI
jgi:hypothetical protein